jgi:ribosomal protein L16 Arg81 hydroxylase
MSVVTAGTNSGLVSDETRRWIAEMLLFGIPPEALSGELQRNGWLPHVAAGEVRRALDSPYLQAAHVLQQRLAKREWILSSIGRLAAMEGLKEIDRADALPPERFFRDYYAAHRPVLISHLVDHWPAMRLWSLDYLEEVLGDPVIEVQRDRESLPTYESESYKLAKQMKLSELLHLLRTGRETNDYYVTAKNDGHNREALARLWDDIGPLPGYLDPQAEADGYFWMGPKGTVTPFHHDLTNNLLVQVMGRKRVTLVPSWDTARMLNLEHCFSSWHSPEQLETLPDEQRPTILSFTLEPGEALFIPVGWWHHVVGLDVTISLSFINFTRPNDFDRNYSCYGKV